MAKLARHCFNFSRNLVQVTGGKERTLKSEILEYLWWILDIFLYALLVFILCLLWAGPEFLFLLPWAKLGLRLVTLSPMESFWANDARVLGCILLLNSRKYCNNTHKYCGNTLKYWANTWKMCSPASALFKSSDNTCQYYTCRWAHFSSIGSILVSITTILASIEQVNTPLVASGQNHFI